MDIIFSSKYKIERKLEKFLERELNYYFKRKWLAEQNKDDDLFDDCLSNIYLINQKLYQQKEKIKEIIKSLNKKRVEELEELLIKEEKEAQEESFILSSTTKPTFDFSSNEYVEEKVSMAPFEVEKFNLIDY